MQSVLQQNAVEVHQQTDGTAAEAEIRQSLGLMDWQNTFDRLEFQQHRIVHDKLSAVAFIEPHLLVNNRKRNLSPHVQAVAVKFPTETFLIDALLQSGTELLMYLDAQPDDPFGQDWPGFGSKDFHGESVTDRVG
jgi:hypothetical protein